MWVCVLGGGEWRWLPWPSPSLLLRQVDGGSKWVEECRMGSKLRRGSESGPGPFMCLCLDLGEVSQA